MARLSKEEYKAKMNGEKNALTEKLHLFLKQALTCKDKIDELTAHYRISGLYNYSFFNSILIMIQGGTIAQSFEKWKKLGRTVNKGAKSDISIYVPMFKKEKDVYGNDEMKLIGFKLGKVFDVSQTNGKELEYDHNSNETLDVPFKTVQNSLEKVAGCKLVEEFTGTARGYSDGNKMVVSCMSNNVDKIKTAIHECAHHIIHQKDKKDNRSRSVKEVEAESVSALVMSFIGLDYSLSKAYVNSWETNIDDVNTDAVVRTADKIIKELKQHMTPEEQFLTNL